MYSVSKATEIADYVARLGMAKTRRKFKINDETIRRAQRRAAQPVLSPAEIRDELDRRERTQVHSHIHNSHHVGIGPNDVLGIIGDFHAPFNHPMYVRFLLDSFEKRGVTKILNIGDLVDNHAISRHVSEPDALDSARELEMARACVREMTSAFPEALMCNGNHDSIPVRQARELGIGPEYIRNIHEVWDVPETWVVREDFTINDVYYFHGVGSSGMHAAYNRAKNMGMSVVQGHCHANGGVKYLTNPIRKWFGMDTGCGIDVKRYAFRYGKASPNRPTLGCGVVYDAEHAEFIPMAIGHGDPYHRSRV